MCLKQPKMPKPTVTTAVEQVLPTEQDAAIQQSRDLERRRRIAAASNTVLTSNQGVAGAAGSAGKTLLGQ